MSPAGCSWSDGVGHLVGAVRPWASDWGLRPVSGSMLLHIFLDNICNNVQIRGDRKNGKPIGSQGIIGHDALTGSVDLTDLERE